MISQKAKESIDHIFAKSARKSLVLAPGDVCDIESLHASVEHKGHGKDVVVLTISSFLFKVLTIFHIGEDDATKNYFLGKAGDKSLTEVFYELGNLCSGAMNHELLRYFPHLGMSTPYALSGQCLSFLKELKPGHLSRHAITINGSATLHATLCICGYAPLDFSVDTTDTADSSGELELF